MSVNWWQRWLRRARRCGTAPVQCTND